MREPLLTNVRKSTTEVDNDIRETLKKKNVGRNHVRESITERSRRLKQSRTQQFHLDRCVYERASNTKTSEESGYPTLAPSVFTYADLDTFLLNLEDGKQSQRRTALLSTTNLET